MFSNVYEYLKSFVYPGSERTISEQTTGFDSKDISNVFQNFKKVQSRYKANKVILQIDVIYRDELSDTIERLKKVNSQVNDDYIVDWINELTSRLTTIDNRIEILKNNQSLYDQCVSDRKDIEKSIIVQKTNHDQDDDPKICRICETNEKNRTLGCGHLFCMECIDQLRRCPLCRTNIDPTEIRPIFMN